MRTVSRSDSTTRDRRFDHFKTFSGRLERQLSNLRGVAVDIEPAADSSSNKIISEEETDDDDGEVPTADRYFALRGAGRGRAGDAQTDGGVGAPAGRDVAVPAP